MGIIDAARAVWEAGGKYAFKLGRLAGGISNLVGYYFRLVDMGQKLRIITHMVKHACEKENINGNPPS